MFVVDFFQSLLEYSFLQNACLAAILAGLACGLVGPLVQANRLSFLTGAMSHTAYGGLGLALFFRLPVLPVTMLFTLGTALVMALFSLGRDNDSLASSESRADTAISIFWAAGMAFGIILIDLSATPGGDLMSFLFGSIMTVSIGDLQLMGLLVLLLLVTIFIFRQGLWAVSLDRDFARARGLPVNALYLLMVALAALTVVMLIRLTGLILVMALMSIPSRMASGLCRSLWGNMFVAALLAVFFCLAGILVSFDADISPGASVVAVATLGAVLFFAARALWQRKRRNKKVTACPPNKLMTE